MKPNDQGSVLMKSANTAAKRTGTWSTAKREFAARVTTSGSFTQKSGTMVGESQRQASIAVEKKK
jgi:hypothetical protein